MSWLVDDMRWIGLFLVCWVTLTTAHDHPRDRFSLFEQPQEDSFEGQLSALEAQLGVLKQFVKIGHEWMHESTCHLAAVNLNETQYHEEKCDARMPWKDRLLYEWQMRLLFANLRLLGIEKTSDDVV